MCRQDPGNHRRTLYRTAVRRTDGKRRTLRYGSIRTPESGRSAHAEKAKEERLEDMIPCIACLQGCVANMYAGKPLCCLTNPFLGHEAEPLKQAETPKKIMVIGGGVAGLCAAFVAKERGHEVTLYEAGGKLGGNMRLAAYPPGKGDITNMIRSYIQRCQKMELR